LNKASSNVLLPYCRDFSFFHAASLDVSVRPHAESEILNNVKRSPLRAECHFLPYSPYQDLRASMSFAAVLPIVDVCEMVLIGAAILPHAAMILDPTMEECPAGVDELHAAAKYVGDYVKDHEPDIVVLATPHGLNLSDAIGIYANHVAAGDAEWNGHWKDFKVSANIHDDFALEIFNHLQKKRVNSNLTLPFGERPAPLGWAEVVPLFFLSEQRGTTGTRKRVCPYDVVVLTTPIQEKKHWDGDLADLTGQCVKVGHELFDLFER